MKKLIIVCEKNSRRYADFLAQLVSLSDDIEGEIVGVKDGAVAAQVWSETDYTHQAVQISSEQYILFIGNSKLIKEKRYHMINKFSKYGMNYGWLGKQAVLYVDDIVDVEHYDEFIEFAKENQSDIKKLIDVKSAIMDTSDLAIDSKEKGIKLLINPLKEIQATFVNAPIRALNAINRLTNSKEIEEQEYTCLTLTFYMNGLSQFLGLSEE